MRVIFITLVMILTISCNRDLVQGRYGEAGDGDCIKFKKNAVYCLRNWLNGEDSGGYWEQIGSTPQNVASLLVGEDPCFDFGALACGQYQFRYIVGDECCRDTAVISPLKCCLSVSINCNN